MENANTIVHDDLNYICSNLQKEFAQMAGRKLLITGGAGFLGYYLCQAILYWNTIPSDSPNIQLTVFDNYVRGIPDWLLELKQDSNVTLAQRNITDPLPAQLDDFDYVIHAAGIASPTFYRAHPIETMDANVLGLRNLLDYSLQQKRMGNPISGLLYFSSSEIYGDPDPQHIPTGESYRGNVSCTGPRACYDESKRYGETLCVNFARQYDLPIAIARPFNNYGPGLKITDRRVIPDFARDVFNGRDIVMFSDGSPRRTFCYVADAVVGYYKILVHGRSGEAYNIGTESPEVSMADLARRIAHIAEALFGYNVRVIHQANAAPDYLTDNPNRRCPRIEKARSELGYCPSISLDEGLRRSLLWYRDHQDAEDA